MGQAESVEQSQSWPLPQQVMPKAEQLCVHDCVQLHGSAGRVCGSVGAGTGSGVPFLTDG